MLDGITLEQLKNMSYEELDKLSSEIRERIIQTVSQNGGHLASNLGVVELTIALHKVFDSPKDKLIFDVSHQTYTHKLLTGRSEEFSSLRKFNGISGFSKYNESIHDAYEAGHSSTAISAGLGYLEAKKSIDGIGEIIAIVGDASFSNGLSFEALNYLGDHKNEKMIIIINDNAMGVSKNVGSLASTYNKLRENDSSIKKMIPLKLRDAINSSVFGSDIYNIFGFSYFENIDGHNIKELVKYLTYAKNSHESVILHVETTKGKGYKYSEEDKLGIWHGVGPFEIQTGTFLNKQKGVPFGVFLSDCLEEFVEKDKRGDLIRVITPAMSLGSGLSNFEKHYPDKFIDAGLAEENATVMAGSMAHVGLLPVLFIYSTFLQRSYDELLHDIARPNEHVVICLDRCGIVENDGDTHQGIYDIAYLSSIPNIEIFSPCSILQTKKALEYALSSSSPVVIRYPKQNLTSLSLIDFSLNWQIVKEGKNYIITYGRMTLEVLEFLDQFENDYGVIDACHVSYIDDEILKLLNNLNSNVIVYEEVIKTSSLGSRIIIRMNELGYSFKINNLCLNDVYLCTGDRKSLLKEYNISLDDLKNLMK